MNKSFSCSFSHWYSYSYNEWDTIPPRQPFQIDAVVIQHLNSKHRSVRNVCINIVATSNHFQFVKKNDIQGEICHLKNVWSRQNVVEPTKMVHTKIPFYKKLTKQMSMLYQCDKPIDIDRHRHALNNIADNSHNYIVSHFPKMSRYWNYMTTSNSMQLRIWNMLLTKLWHQLKNVE